MSWFYDDGYKKAKKNADPLHQSMLPHLLNIVLDLVIGLTAVLAVVGFLRNRKVRYRDIVLSEIVPDVAAGEELLKDALNERARAGTAAREPSPRRHQ